MKDVLDLLARRIVKSVRRYWLAGIAAPIKNLLPRERMAAARSTELRPLHFNTAVMTPRFIHFAAIITNL